MDLERALRSYREWTMQQGGVSPGLPDKEWTLAEFRKARKAYNEAPYKAAISLRREGPPGSSAPFLSLHPILLRQMTLDCRPEGRVLHGTLIEVPYKLTGIMTILEDSAGDVIPMTIYHVANSSTSSATVEAMFPMGMRVAVREPYMKVGEMSGKLVRKLQVDNPADIMDLGAVAGEEAGSDSSKKTAQSLGEEGNRYFAAQQWDRAIEAYSRCLRILEAKSSSPNFVELCAVVYSNRAEAWLRLDHHANALNDALKSLELDKSNSRCLVRKAKALYGLRCYQEAILCLQNLIRQKPPLPPQKRRELIQLLKEVEASDQQSRLGTYNLKSFFRRGTQPTPTGQMCDFVGPVEVRKLDSDNPARGRGLFATRDVKAGDLLLVSNALGLGDTGLNRHPGIYISFSASKVYENSTEDLITRLVGIIKRNAFRRKQLYSLSDSTLASVCEVPPMTLFTPPANSTEALAMAAELENAVEEVDVARVRRIVEVNAFDAKQTREGHVMDKASGLWVLPSLINHSCVPNAQRSGPGGDVMFIRATRDIRKGEEVTMLYCGGHQTILQRNSILSGFKFECWCPRCLFERSFAKTVPELTGLAEDSVGLLREDSETPIAEVVAAGTRIATAVEEILRQAPEHDADKKNWIRASFRRAYMCQASQLMHSAMKTCDWEPWTVAMNSAFDMMLSVIPDEEVLTHVCNAIHHLPVSKTCRASWTQLAKRICTLIFGPLDNDSLNLQVKIFAKVPLFPPMVLLREARDSNDACV